MVSLVGYTNAGKSTLLNRLTDAGVLVENRLFSTLDSRTRRLALPGGETVLLSDTVGFVRKLPHQLVEAFRSTLEVVTEADLLLHVVDASAPEPEMQIDAVRTVLDEIDAAAVPELLVMNKADRAPRAAARLANAHAGAVVVSALTGEGIEQLLRALGDHLRVADRVVELVVPFDRGDVLAAVHREGEVVDESHSEGATVVHVVLDDAGRRPVPGIRGVVSDSDPPGLLAAALPLRPPRGRRRGSLRRIPVASSTCRSAPPATRRPRRWSTALGDLGDRAWVPGVDRHHGVPRGGRRVGAPALRGVDRPVAGRGVRRHQGVRGQHRVVPATAHSRSRHRAGTRRSPTRPMRWERAWPECRLVAVPAGVDGGLDLSVVADEDAGTRPVRVGQ